MDIENTTWSESDDFIAFAFGDFDSKAKGIIRTSDSDRYNNNLSPQLQDKTADIPGANGQFYFGTQHKTQSFTISFAFEKLSITDIRELKKAFSGKDLKELIFSESVAYDNTGKPDTWKIYMAKVTSQPTIKYLPFDENGVEVYKGEGSIQFTAYWPYCRDNIQQTIPFTTAANITLPNSGDIPANFVFEANANLEVSQIEVGSTVIQGTNITYWNSKTGIIKSDDEIISYTGDGLYQIPVGGVTAKLTYKTGANPSSATFKYYNWYY